MVKERGYFASAFHYASLGAGTGILVCESGKDKEKVKIA
jgi:hypothetical protein